MELKFKRLNSRAELPRKAHATDAGLDLTVTSFSMDHKANTIQYGFGLAVEIPAGHVGLLFPPPARLCIRRGYRSPIAWELLTAAIVGRSRRYSPATTVFTAMHTASASVPVSSSSCPSPTLRLPGQMNCQTQIVEKEATEAREDEKGCTPR